MPVRKATFSCRATFLGLDGLLYECRLKHFSSQEPFWNLEHAGTPGASSFAAWWVDSDPGATSHEEVLWKEYVEWCCYKATL